MKKLAGDIPKRRRFKAGMVGGGKGAFFASYHRAAMRLCNRFEIVAGAFSSDSDTGREAGEAFDVEPGRIYDSFVEMAEREAMNADRIDVAIVSLPAGNTEGYLEALAVLYSDFATALEAGAAWRSSVATRIPDIVEGWRGVALSEAAVRSDASRAWVTFSAYHAV